MGAHKIGQLEGVRAVGALIVFVCHFQIIIVPDFYDAWYKLMYPYLGHTLSNFTVVSANLMINGNMVLHIFWALSAYVIFKKFFEYGAADGLIISSSVKRYFRLMLPCAVSIFFSYAIYKAGLIYVRQIPVQTLQENLYLIPPSLLHAIKTSVWSTLFNYDYFNSYNGPLWTIEREFYGSLFCFGLFGLVGRSYRRGAIYLGIFVIVGLLKMYWLNSFLFGYYLSDYDFATTNSPSVRQRIQKINEYIATHQLLLFGLFIIFFLGCKLVIYKYMGRMDMVNSFLCALVILVTFRINLINRFMAHKALVSLGKISFSIYLLHWPVMCSFTSWAYLRYNNHTLAFTLLLFFLTLGITIALAWVFYKLVDMKSIVFANKVGKRFHSYIIPKRNSV